MKNMDKEQFEEWAMDYLSDTLNAEEKSRFENFLVARPEYRENFETLKMTWSQLDALSFPEPSETMDEKFYGMLHSEMDKKEQHTFNWINTLKSYLDFLFKPQLAYGIVLLLIGLGMGYYMNSGKNLLGTEPKMVHADETNEVREKLVLTLLEQPSANQRLQGINEAVKFKDADDKVIKALLKTLNNDDNVNVRLAAIESLVNYLDNPIVREGLVASIVEQDSPIVQVTLADLMVALQEKKSIEPFKKLMRTQELNGAVKQKLEKSIQKII